MRDAKSYCGHGHGKNTRVDANTERCGTCGTVSTECRRCGAMIPGESAIAHEATHPHSDPCRGEFHVCAPPFYRCAKV